MQQPVTSGARSQKFLSEYSSVMTRIWGIHNDQPVDLVSGGFVSIGWSELGNLASQPTDRESLKARMAEIFTEAKAGAIPVWAGIICRFVEEIQIGDLVVSPNKILRTINIGKVTSNYYYEEDAEFHPNRRRIEWLKTDIPRSDLPQSALNELGSAITLFEVKRHRAVIEGFLGDSPTTMDLAVADEEAVADEPNAARVEVYSRDFVESSLRQMDPERFEHFVAALIQAMGYRADVTQLSGDGGVDVLASTDPLRLTAPVIKVQVKRTTNTIGGPQVQALIGALAAGGNELALFVTLGNYSSDAIHISRTRQDIRLLTGREFIDLVLEYYERLAPEWRAEIPLRHVLAVDRAI